MLNPIRSGSTPTQPRTHHPIWLILLTGCWLAGIGNIALWRHLTALPELHNVRGVALGVAFFVVILAGSVAVLTLFSWRGLLKPMVTFVLIAAAIGAYFMLAFGIVLDPTMMVNTVQTSPSEAGALLGWRFFVLLGVLGMLPAWLAWRMPLRALPLRRRALGNVGLLLAAVVLMAVMVLSMFQDFASLMRNHPQLRYKVNPFNSIFSLINSQIEQRQKHDRPLLSIGQDARLGASYSAQMRPPLLLLVLGETARSGNFGVNGYARTTTPELSALDAAGALVSQRNAWSCGTNTATSLPCMFSHQDRRAHEDRVANYENLLDVLQHAGLAVLWIDNQSGCKGVCDRIAHTSTANLSDPDLCADGECFDAIMLKQLDAQIAALPPQRVARGVVVVLHQMGSHGPAYFRRSPAALKPFLLECEQAALQACSQQQLVNAYDNTIVYTDHFLGSAVHWLDGASARFNGALLYLSDHGESLGENRIYLHGLPYRVAPDVQKHVPWITWVSKGFDARAGIDMNCLRSHTDQRISHDNYFHSVLGLMDIDTSVYLPSLDLYKPCTEY